VNKPDLAKLLATLDAYANGADAYCMVSAEAARMLREMARDFADVGSYMMEYGKEGARIPIDMRQYLLLSEKMERWRLPK